MNAYPEGRLTIRLARGPAGVEAELGSSRLYAAARWFEGKTVAETLKLLPLLFRVCGTAQANAAVAAVENARGITVDAAVTSTRAMIVLAETFREHLLRILTTWHDPAVDPPLTTRLSEVMRLPSRLNDALYGGKDAFMPGGGRLTKDDVAVHRWLDDTRDLLASAVLGCTADEWLAMTSMQAVRDWASSASGVAPRFVQRLIDHGWAGKGANSVKALPALPTDELADRLASDTADSFLAAPHWGGEVFETGAFARTWRHLLVKQASSAYGNGLMAHSLARLVEVAGIPRETGYLFASGDGTPQETVTRPGFGIGQVEAARGRLVHRIVLDGERVTSYRMLAPTEWNFHPRGVVYQALNALDPDDDLRHLGSLLIEAVDPCVGYDLEVTGDA